MNHLIAWLIGTPSGLFIFGGIIYLIIKRNKEIELEKQKKEDQKERRRMKKENTIVIKEETKTTIITKPKNNDL
jgi:hypothetical protein